MARRIAPLLTALALGACSPSTVPVDAATALDATPAMDQTPALDAPDATSSADVPAVIDAPSVADGADAAAVDVPTDAPPPTNCDPAASTADLRAGLARIDVTGAAPSSLTTFAVGAFPVLLGAGRAPYLVASCVGAGRVVLAGHESFFGGTADDRPRLVANAMRWLSRGHSVVVGVEGSNAALVANLCAAGFTTRTATVADLASVQVWIPSLYTDRSTSDLAAIAAFLARGGAVLAGGQGWSWAGSHGGVSMEQYPGNRWLIPMGVAVSSETDVASMLTPATPAPVDLDAARTALDRVADHVAHRVTLSLADVDIASNAVRRALRLLSVSSDYVAYARTVRPSLPTVIPTAAHPVTPATQPVEALALTLDAKLALELPAAEVTAHPAAADFPGAPTAGAMTTTVSLSVDGTYAGREAPYIYAAPRAAVWRSLGVYAAPGAQVTVTVSDNATHGGVDVLVGQHTDTLWSLASWPRVPQITRAWPVTATTTTVANAFGGPVYVRVAAGSTLGPIAVTVRGALPMPLFVAGTTTPAQWQSMLATTAAPWVELASAKLALHLPIATVRALSDPTALLAWWDSVLDSHADLATIPHARVRAERAVTDREISAGYMHSGYPVMAHLDSAAGFVDLAALARSGDWGLFHELGHNHQWADWVLPGATEASVNLYSVHAMQYVVGLAPVSGHPAITPAMRDATIRAYVAGGRNFARDWNVWTALETYLQLEEGFGWPLFTTLFAEYRALAAADRPADDAARVQQWIVRSSQASGRNLGDFYAMWGFPMTDATRSAIASLPAWTANPMARY